MKTMKNRMIAAVLITMLQVHNTAAPPEEK